ncbi:MAG: topoisomerase-4 subunit A [Patiriisocius sp.]|jgi:topoisomerase-4 subunit A
MAEEEEDNIQDENQEDSQDQNENPEEGGDVYGDDEMGGENVISVAGMYREWFLDYASYVILERAVPHIIDGFKPVQRRLMHSMKRLDDGRYNKVANIIGHTMQFHPHGDASIGDALVQMGQKDLLVDAQGNWGNVLTGDRAAAPRYIEARLSKFALDVVFNPKITKWQSSYDGRNKEPIDLPVKFPLLLTQGAEGIAVGLACKILPHNFIEIIDAAIAHLKGKSKRLYPDFPNGALADFSNYNDGKRGGKVRVRAKITQLDKNTLVVTEIPHKSTTSALIESILKANEKGKIKVKKIEDNTAATAEIVIHMPPKTSPDKMIDALYAFTDCEISISPNSVVIDKDKPVFLTVSEMLKISVDQTKDFLRQELEIRKEELELQWHFASLEKIFIEKKIYRDIEEEETWEGVISAIDKGLKKYIKHLKRPVTEEDIVRLTEIKIKRISKFDKEKADKNIERLEDELEEVQGHLDTLTDFAIEYFKNLKKKYGKGKERKTEIKSFEDIVRTKVVVANKKLYVNHKEGFMGYSLRHDEYISDCSDIDDIIIFRKDGVMMVTKVDAKKFVGKDIIHAAVWKKGDRRTIYNVVYQDGTGGNSYIKRFDVTSITRDKEYNLTRGTKGSRITYFTENPNGQAEVISVKLRPRPKLKKLKFDFDFSDLGIKGRQAKGNTLTKNLISKIELKEAGKSTLSARKIWFDEVVRRLNVDGRGKYLGAFKASDRLLLLSKNGFYRLVEPKLSLRFTDDLTTVEKWKQKIPISIIYWDGERKRVTAKRFIPELSNSEVRFVNENENTTIEVIASHDLPIIKLEFDKRSNDRPDEEINLSKFIEPKGISSVGNRLTAYKVKSYTLLPFEEIIEEDEPVKEEIADEILDTDTEQEEVEKEVTKKPKAFSEKGKEWKKDDITLDLDSEESATLDMSVKPSKKSSSGEEKPKPKKKFKRKNTGKKDDEDQIGLF